MASEPGTTLAERAAGAGAGAEAVDRGRSGARRALRSGVVVAALGAASVLALFAVIFALQAAGRSAAAVAMPSMHMERMGVYWAFPLLQASGIAGLVWAYAGVVLGLAASGGRSRWWPVGRERTQRWHRQVSLLVVALSLVHAVATVFDAMGDSWASAFLPWQASWQAARFAYTLGIVALYAAVLLEPTYYLRRWIGVRTWRLVHRAAVAVYVLSVWHTLLLGADFSYHPWVRPVTWLAQVPLLALVITRLLRPARRARTGWPIVRYGLVAVCGAAAVGIVVLVAGGHAGWPARVGGGTPGAVDLLPGWLRIGAALGCVVVAGVHVWHLRPPAVAVRWWHAGHVLMALGMIDMFVPAAAMVVPAFAARIVFAAAATAVLVAAVVMVARRRRPSRLWVALAVDLAAMVYMFALPRLDIAWLTWLAVGWFVVQAVGWMVGPLTPMRCTPDQDPVDAGDAGHERGVRITLAVMQLGMAYMFVAMQIGMHAGAGMPGMSGM